MKQLNVAKSTAYTVTFSEHTKLTYRALDAAIGSLTVGLTPVPIRYSAMYVPDNTIEFGQLPMKFLCSEELAEWIDMYKWMLKCTTMDNMAHREVFDRMELTVLNSQNVPILRFTYKDVWPTELGQVTYSIEDEEQTQYFDVTFVYTSLSVEIISTGEKIGYDRQEG